MTTSAETFERSKDHDPGRIGDGLDGRQGVATIRTRRRSKFTRELRLRRFEMAFRNRNLYGAFCAAEISDDNWVEPCPDYGESPMSKVPLRDNQGSARRLTQRILLPVLVVLGCVAVVVYSRTRSSGSFGSHPVSTGLTGGGIGDVAAFPDQVTISAVSLPLGGGFVVVYADAGGVPGRQVGASAKVAAGLQKDLEVAVSSKAAAYWVVVHRDVDGDGVFDSSIDTAMSDPVTGLVVSRQTN
jgi:hypothetical protein